jgi:DNA-binding SARP family transcriptional activator
MAQPATDAVPIQLRLTDGQRRALLHHVRAELSTGAFDAATDAARALTVLDPLSREGWMALADAHRGAGRGAHAGVAARVARALGAT